MALPRTFVGFSSTDIDSYRLMCNWKAHEKINFDFCDCQLDTAINSGNEAYIKSRCRDRLQMAGTYALLIGSDTFYKEKFVLWEAEVAIEKKCRLIGVNLDKWRVLNPARCPSMFQSVDAVFVRSRHRSWGGTREVDSAVSRQKQLVFLSGLGNTRASDTQSM
jgi:hypothetical protein